MSDLDTRKLLREALDFLNDRPSFGLRHDRRQTSYGIAARIDAHLAKFEQPPPPAVAIARERWCATSFLRVDPDECMVEQAADGVWVRAWIKIGHASTTGFDAVFGRRYENAVTALPDLTRRVFLAHRVDDLAYGEIARRIGMTVAEVEHHVADALAAIARALSDA